MRGVSLDYVTSDGRTIHALREVDLTIPAGSSTAICGASGSGKSSVLRLMARLATPTAGEIRFCGSSQAPSVGFVAMLLQGASHFPWRTVEGNLRFRLALSRMPLSEQRERAKELCTRIGLEPRQYLNRYPTELSGGELRRVELGMTLSTNPALRLLDEPTSGLDYLVKRDIQQLLEDLVRDESSATVIVSHDVEEAALLGDRIVVIAEGHVVGQISVPLGRPRLPDHLANPELHRIISEVIRMMRSASCARQ